MRLYLVVLSTIIICAACQPKPVAKQPEQPWHWEWSRSQGGGSSEQFSRDKYACLQDYRQTASPYTQRDPVTEMKFMTMHQEICLESKGWRKVAGPAAESKQLIYWRPSGWVTAPAGTKKIDWAWQGPAAEEMAAFERFQSDKTNCAQAAGISDPRSSTAQQGDAFMACMWEKKWGAEPF
jgi:hypothetical protein